MRVAGCGPRRSTTDPSSNIIVIIQDREGRWRSFGADVGVVGFGVVDFGEDGDDGLGELVHLDVPFLEDVDALFRRTAADVEEDSSRPQHLVDIVNGPSDIPGIEAVQGGFLDYAIRLEIRPLLRDIYPLPPNAPLEVAFFAFLLVDERPAEIRPQ